MLSHYTGNTKGWNKTVTFIKARKRDYCKYVISRLVILSATPDYTWPKRGGGTKKKTEEKQEIELHRELKATCTRCSEACRENNWCYKCCNSFSLPLLPLPATSQKAQVISQKFACRHPKSVKKEHQQCHRWFSYPMTCDLKSGFFAGAQWHYLPLGFDPLRNQWRMVSSASTSWS